MKRLWLVLIILLSLIGCTDQEAQEKVLVALQTQLDETIKTYESKLTSLKEDHATAVEALGSEKEALSSELKRLKNEFLIIEKAYIALNENIQEDEALYKEMSNHLIILTLLGVDVLEDGTVVMLEVYDLNKQLIWAETWNGVHISELAPHSQVAIKDDALYIAVNGTLYGFELHTGRQKFQTEGVGFQDDTPLVSEDRVFVIGQYAPYISAVSLDGKILWQETDETYHGVYGIAFDGADLVIDCFKGRMKFSQDGVFIEQLKEE